MKIKVCGLKDADNLKAVAALAPDYMGFICYGLSPRFIAGLQADVLASLPKNIIKTGVFVNETLENIKQMILEFAFDAVQLHGSESPAFCAALRDKVIVLKAFGMDESFDFDQLDAYQNSVDYFLFDTKTSKHGGSGQTFNWDILQQYRLDVPFFLSGGLSLDNLPEVEKIKHPAFYGVDLNSRFETGPGIKDIKLLQKAFNLLKQPVTE